MSVAVLFIDPAGVYTSIPDVDTWGPPRDARLYDGDYPVICHPPCQLWSRFAKVNYIRWGGDQRGRARNKPTISGRAASATPRNFAIALLTLARNSSV